ncbi:pyridoxamine 5'-phosphate oxidase family protein [Acinetobacter puyangensis]|uniref:pyridoxamine 5'-phosphate oxidase family protein n=1 Tax=Acinetobacter puyangensis TaxID=1096779 RepID=UPI003A4E09A7
MNTLDDAMKAMFAKQLPIQATVSKEGLPDIGPKRSLRVYDDHSLIYNENTGGQTLQNLKDGSKIVVAIIDREALDGYRFLGHAELLTEGEAYENCKVFAANNNMKEPKYAVVIHIEEIFSLRSGPNAGKKL